MKSSDHREHRHMAHGKNRGTSPPRSRTFAVTLPFKAHPVSSGAGPGRGSSPLPEKREQMQGQYSRVTEVRHESPGDQTGPTLACSVIQKEMRELSPQAEELGG